MWLCLNCKFPISIFYFIFFWWFVVKEGDFVVFHIFGKKQQQKNPQKKDFTSERASERRADVCVYILRHIYLFALWWWFQRKKYDDEKSVFSNEINKKLRIYTSRDWAYMCVCIHHKIPRIVNFFLLFCFFEILSEHRESWHSRIKIQLLCYSGNICVFSIYILFV